MKHFFLDTNIIIDLLAKRLPFAPAAMQLFEAAAKKQVTLYVSSLSFANVHYTLRKATSPAISLDLLQELAGLVRIIAIDESVVRQALATPNPDFEDALQYFSAQAVTAIELIVTRDPKGFSTSNLPTATAAEAVAKLA